MQRIYVAFDCDGGILGAFSTRELAQQQIDGRPWWGGYILDYILDQGYVPTVLPKAHRVSS